MAATPLNNSLLQKLNPELSLRYRVSYSTINLPKRRRRIPHRACNNISGCSCSSGDQISSDSLGGGGGKKKSNSIEMQKLIEDDPYQLTSKDSSSISLPSTSRFSILLVIVCFVFKNLFFLLGFILVRCGFLFLGPLTSASVSNLASEGTRLRVAYQVRSMID